MIRDFPQGSLGCWKLDDDKGDGASHTVVQVYHYLSAPGHGGRGDPLAAVPACQFMPTGQGCVCAEVEFCLGPCMFTKCTINHPVPEALFF